MASSNPISEFISTLMASKSEQEKNVQTHLSSLVDGAKWRLEDDLPARKKTGFHRHHQHTSSEGFPEVPRQYIVTTHSQGQNYATYAANSYASAIAIQEEMKTREF
ncbi:unnamed protein product [Hyaloperonospora brassicae]|uniref:Uncharacterized protein n=1 Tax=Hyaloperonospora brassicae TaxID=162125 RepID=A0AAV0THB9_HYABA|nr:unnamed protein product [Hyaloperonospora brassicae]